MKKQKTVKSLMIVVLLAFAVNIVVVPSSDAKWRDNSDDLPGMQNFPTELAIVAGVLVIGGITYFIVKKSKKDKTEKTDIGQDTETSTTDSVIDSNSDTESVTSLDNNKSVRNLNEHPVSEKQKSRVGFYLNVDQDNLSNGINKSELDFSDVSVKVGFSIGF